MLDVRHQECGAVAFRMRCTIDEARQGVILNNAMLAYDDGRTLNDDDGTGTLGDIIRCQVCGGIVRVSVIGDEAVAIAGFEINHNI